jgi:hypothetical protein
LANLDIFSRLKIWPLADSCPALAGLSPEPALDISQPLAATLSSRQAASSKRRALLENLRILFLNPAWSAFIMAKSVTVIGLNQAE